MFGKKFLELSIRLHRASFFRLIPILLSVNLAIGCAYQKPTLIADPIIKSTSNNENETSQLQDEIDRLQKLVEEKDEVIRKQHAHQKIQVKEQQEASSEVVRVQTRLHRLATKPSTASTIAEVEVAMESLNQIHTSSASQALQQEAQRLLDTALAFYERGEYAVAMNYASQAHEFVSMVADEDRNVHYSDRKTVPIYTPIMLKTMANVNLRKSPHADAEILNTFERGVVLITDAYRGNWFRVQADDERQGWVLNILVSAIAVNPKDVTQD